MRTTATTGTHIRTTGPALLVLVAALLLASVVPATAGSGAADQAPTHQQASKRLVTWKGDGAKIRRASGDLQKLDATTRAFKAFTRKKLDQLWGWTDHDPACAKAPVIYVKRWRSDGWAQIPNMGVFGPRESCIQGGHWEIWAIKDGRWRTVLGGQDLPRCSQLRRKQVPAKFADVCYNADAQAVHYTGP